MLLRGAAGDLRDFAVSGNTISQLNPLLSYQPIVDMLNQ